MNLNGMQRRELQEALLAAFPTEGDLRNMVDARLDQNLASIAGSGALRDVVFSLITWAVARGQDEKLVRGALAEAPASPKLRAFAQQQGLPLPPLEDTSTVTPAPVPVQPGPPPSAPIASAPTRNQVFISYGHQDRKWLDMLNKMLAPLVRQERVKIWDDTQIRPGTKWREEIQQALASAKVAVLLVSPDFLASDFITQHEVPAFLKAAEQAQVKILWVAVSYSLYKATPIAEYQAVNEPAHPLDSLSGAKLNREILRIAEAITAALDGG